MVAIDFHPLAELELRDAVNYYAEIDDELGRDFRIRVEKTCRLITKDPEIWRDRGSYQRYNLLRFPYYVAFVVRDETLWVVAVAHAHREPDYWTQRIDGL